MSDISLHFSKLNYQEILAVPFGKYDDDELLRAVEYFDEHEDDRALAVEELILRSPDNREMLDYIELYQDLIDRFTLEKNYPAVIQWAYAQLAYSLQHEPEQEGSNSLRNLANSYIASGDLNTGLGMYTRLLEAAPGNLWTYDDLGVVLQDYGLAGLAIKALQRGLTLTQHPKYEDLKDQLEAVLQEAHDTLAMAEAVDPTGQIAATVLAEFKAALDLPIDSQPSEEDLLPYLLPVTHLVHASQQLDADLTAGILAQGKLLAPELVRLAFDKRLRDTAAPVHAVSLLRQLQRVMPIEFAQLSSWLDKADGNWQVELLSDTFGKIGGYSTSELEGVVVDSSHAEGLRTAALEALVNRAEKLSDQRPRVVALLRTLLTRPEAYQAIEETVVGFAVNFSLDLDARELYPQIKAVFDEDRIDPMMVALEDVHQRWDLPYKPEPDINRDGMLLLIKCTACGRVRRHFTRYVLVDQGTLEKKEKGQKTNHDPCILDHEIICPKCGARDRYEMTLFADIAIYGPQNIESLEQMISAKGPSKPKLNPRVFFFKAVALGRPMHPLDAMEEYRWNIVRKPGDPGLHLGLGNILRLLSRFDQAIEEYHFAHEISPTDVDILLTLAMAEHDFGDSQVARQLYEKVVALKLNPAHASSLYSEAIEGSAVALQGLDALIRGRPSPWELDIHNSENKSLTSLIRSSLSDQRAGKGARKHRK